MSDRVWVVLLLLLPAGCSDLEVEDSSGSAVADSAGVSVVAGDHGGFDQPADVVLSEPLFEIGWGNEGPFFQNVTYGRVLADGGAVVFDGGSNLLYYLSRAGTVDQVRGGAGQGPGEFQGLQGLAILPGDSIAAHDFGNARVTILEPGGESVRSFPSTRTRLVNHSVSAATASGHLVWTPSSFMMRGFTSPGWVEAPIFTTDASGQAQDTVASLPFFEVLMVDGRPTDRLFRPTGWMHGTDQGFVWSRNDRAEVRWFDESGRLTRIVRWSEVPTPVTEATWADYVDAYVDWASSWSSEADVRRQMAERRSTSNPALPLFRSLATGSDGSVWLEEWTFPGHDPTRYLALPSSGSTMLNVDVGRGFEFLDARGDLLLAIRRDTLDVQAVVLFRGWRTSASRASTGSE